MPNILTSGTAFDPTQWGAVPPQSPQQVDTSLYSAFQPQPASQVPSVYSPVSTGTPWDVLTNMGVDLQKQKASEQAAKEQAASAEVKMKATIKKNNALLKQYGVEDPNGELATAIAQSGGDVKDFKDLKKGSWSFDGFTIANGQRVASMSDKEGNRKTITLGTAPEKDLSAGGGGGGSPLSHQVEIAKYLQNEAKNRAASNFGVKTFVDPTTGELQVDMSGLDADKQRAFWKEVSDSVDNGMSQIFGGASFTGAAHTGMFPQQPQPTGSPEVDPLIGQKTSKPDGQYNLNGKVYTVKGGIIQQ